MNIDKLLNHCANDLEFVKELLLIFSEDADVFLKNLTNAISSNEVEKTRLILHKMKPTINMISTEEFYLKFSNCELFLKNNNDLSPIKSKLDEIIIEVAILKNEAKDFIVHS